MIITAANSLGNYCVTDAESDASLAHTGPDAPLAYFSSAPNSPLKVDLDPRQAYFICFFFLLLLICLFVWVVTIAIIVTES